MNRGTELLGSAASRWLTKRNYVLALLILIFAVQYLDRQIIVVLSQPIKEEFALSDSRMGLLAGLVFSVPYCIMVLPFGVLVDRVNRRNLLATVLSVWSLLTAVTGFARSLWELMFVRAMIGAAESANNPSALSIISDHFDRTSRATAVGLFYGGPGLANVLGFTLLAVVADQYGWRYAFFVAGIPGLLLALLFFTTVSEPPRGTQDAAKRDIRPSFRETLLFIRSQHSILHFIVAMTLTAVIASGQMAWVIPMLMRSHQLSLTEAALAVSIAHGGMNFAGHVFGGLFVDRWAHNNVTWYAWWPAIFATMTLVFMAGSVLTTSVTAAIIMIALWSLPAGCQYGPVMGSIQSLVLPRMRGVAASSLGLLVNLVGAGLGPLIVGVLSDSLSAAGDRSLNWALALVSLVQLVAITHFMLASRRIKKEMERVSSVLEGEADESGRRRND